MCSIPPLYQSTGSQYFIASLLARASVVLRIGIADVIPGRTSPLRHGIGLTFCRSSAARAGGVDPVCHGSQRRLAVIGRHVALYIRQAQRKRILPEPERNRICRSVRSELAHPSNADGRIPSHAAYSLFLLFQRGSLRATQEFSFLLPQRKVRSGNRS